MTPLAALLLLAAAAAAAAHDGLDAARRTHHSGSALSNLARRRSGDVMSAEAAPCVSLRAGDEDSLLCTDRRNKFNFNPFGLRFGKRLNGYVYRRAAVKRARVNKRLSPLTLFSRDLEVPT